MALSNTALRYYDCNVLRLPADKRKEYHEQVDRLVTELCKSLRNRTEVKITKVVKAGSFAKYTILRKTSVDPVDVDVVVYIADKDADQETLQSLNDTIYELLIKQYPTKSVEDFEIQRKAATVTFAGTGLSVDIVPVIEDPDRPGYGWQFDLQTGDPVETCAPGQIKFVRDDKVVMSTPLTDVTGADAQGVATVWGNYPLAGFEPGAYRAMLYVVPTGTTTAVATTTASFTVEP